MSLSLSLLKAKEEPVACFLSIFAVVLLALGGRRAEGGYKSRLAKHRQQKDSVEGFCQQEQRCDNRKTEQSYILGARCGSHSLGLREEWP